MAEHRLYLPLAVVLVLVAVGLEKNSRRDIHHGSFPWPRTTFAVIAPMAVLLGIADVSTQSGTTPRRSACGPPPFEDYPGNLRALENVGCALSAEGKLSEAVTTFTAVVNQDPRYPDAQENLANCLVAVGRIREAIPHYEVAAQEPSRAAVALNRLGGRLVEAARAVRPCDRQLSGGRCSANPILQPRHNNLANTLVGIPGRFEEAIAEYKDGAPTPAE